MSRLFWCIIRGAAIIVFALGVIFILGVLAGLEEEMLVPGIVMAAVGLVAVIVAGKMGHKAKSNKVRKALKACKHCGGAYGSQYEYTYELGKANKSPYSGLLVVPGTITFTCTKCGKSKIFAESFEIAGVKPEKELQEVIEERVHSYIG